MRVTIEDRIEDRRLLPILDKVRAGRRLDFLDGVTLYQSPDILGVGYMANLVRERLHGDTTYYNVNRHINPTDVDGGTSSHIDLPQEFVDRLLGRSTDFSI